MNGRGRNYFSNLQVCKACGMDAGIRMVTDTVPEEFYVVCQICGYKTRKHSTQSAATNEWTRRGGNA